MDFFERQDRARRSTKWLVLYFVAAVVCIIAGIYLVFAGIFLRDQFQRNGPAALWNLQMFLGVAGGTCLIVLFGSLFKMAELRRGGAAVAEMLGGTKISPNTDDADERRLLNVVEEMALASGTAVPPVYLLPDEGGINAFAAGFAPNDAVIGVTRGCVKILSRDELQGVIAHEFSHILNGDMRMNLRLMGVIFGILCLAVIGRVLLYSTSRRAYYLGARNDNRGGNPLPFIGLALIVIGSIGVFFGRLIQAAVSRQREFLADASAVQFTRNPDGIAGALKKIGGLREGSRLHSPHASEASHMFFGNGLGSSFLGLMATHPPLIDRIKAIDPNFDGEFPQIAGITSGTASPLVSQMVDTGAMPPPMPRRVSRASVSAREVLHTTGVPKATHLEASTAWRDSLPDELLSAIRDPARAPMVIFGLLLDNDETIREKQLSAIASGLSADARATTENLRAVTSDLAPTARLPLLELTIPALRELSPEDYRQFRAVARQLIEADRQVDLFEYALEKCLDRHLAPAFEGRRRDVIQYYSMAPLMEDVARVLALLTRLGHKDPEAAGRAYAEAIVSLGANPANCPAPPERESGLRQVDEALNKLAHTVPIIKKRFLQAAAHAVASDGELAPREAEMLRAIADAVDCPIPPFIDLHRVTDEEQTEDQS
ncbi:M48 family metalloprotease [bacterium]|nr:M48 family metalloprotease [bacterium]